MAWRYRGPKGYVSRGVYERYKYLETYLRISDAKWNLGGRKTPASEKQTSRKALSAGINRKSSPSQTPPSTPSEWERMMDTRLKKLSKRKRAEFYQEEYEGPEYETGVDY
jgi:hypothetical protein